MNPRQWPAVIAYSGLYGLVLLLAFHGRALAAAALRNGAALLLRPSWGAAAAEAGIPPCGAGAEPAARVWIARALRLNPRDERAWLLAGRAHWLAGRCEEAIWAWEQALSLAPGDRAAWALYLAAGGEALQPNPAVAEGVAKYFLFLGDRSGSAEQWEGQVS